VERTLSAACLQRTALSNPHRIQLAWFRQMCAVFGAFLTFLREKVQRTCLIVHNNSACIVIAVLVLIAPCVAAQSFIDVALEQGIIHQTIGSDYGCGASFYDINKDGWDDLTILSNGNDVQVFINHEGNFAPPITIASNTHDIKMVLWVDYDNDGDADLFITRKSGPWSLLRNDGDLLQLVDVTESSGLPPDTQFDTYGAGFADINRDGHLDLYICNYNFDGITNFLYLSNGDGSFTEATQQWGVTNGSMASFQPFFIDYNHDLWPDLFIVNDRLPWSNHMYRNTGTHFEDYTSVLGLTDYFFSMNASAADIDHSGHMDIYVSNNPTGNRLYKQQSDFTYQNIANEAGVAVMDHSWSAQWMDVDLDGYEDLHVACSPFWNQPGQNRFFMNNADGTFDLAIDEYGFSSDKGPSYSSVSGDFDNDGYFDLFVVNGAPYHSRLWKYSPPFNHANRHVKVRLEGTASNRDGIGVWMHLYNDGDRQMRYTHCGEGYLSQNSQTEIFGVGESMVIDSLVLLWPSGHRDVHQNLSTNATYSFIEGQGASIPLYASALEVCPGDSVLLSTTAIGQTQWNIEGVTTDSVWVYSPGTYSCSVLNEFGVWVQSPQVEIVSKPFAEYNVTSQVPACDGEESGMISVVAEGSDETVFIYHGNAMHESILDGLTTGTHMVSFSTPTSCLVDTVIEIGVSPSFFVTVMHSPILCHGDSTTVQLFSFGESFVFDAQWHDVNPDQAPAGTYTLSVISNYGCILELSYSIEQPPPLEVEITLNNDEMNALAFGGTPPYAFIWETPLGELVASNELPTTIDGVYTLTLTDANGCELVHTETVLSSPSHAYAPGYLSLYPNPGSVTVTIESQACDLIEVLVFDVSGRPVKAFPIRPVGRKALFQVDDLRPGSYVFNVRCTNGDFGVVRFFKTE